MKATIVGGGVIGGGWAARFLLNGHDVQVFDPDPEADRKIGAVLENARLALPGLIDRPMPDEGQLTIHDRLEEALAGTDWVAESVPERVDLKRKVYAQIEEAVGPEVIIASSTSGFTPTELCQGARHPGRIIVAHPFNPVYLLPLVELVGEAGSCERAAEVLTSIGMAPLTLRKEIPAHIADRLLEAVWREALWLVKDGVATTKEIDEAIRLGFGLRWAQMGLFETYRIAGGEPGMRHFMAQFGPTLALPWTKLTDVPEFDDSLVELIAGQSDEQSGAYGIRDLERIRDTNLVAFLRALKLRNWGAGAVIKSSEAPLAPPEDLSRPIVTAEQAIPLDWTDYNGHMNEARYLEAFGAATDRLMEIIGCDASYIAEGGSYFTVETHIRHLGEVHAGQRIRIETTVLSGESKKMHLFHAMFLGETCVATGEHLLIHVSLETRRSSVPAEPIATKLQEIAGLHARLPAPQGAGAAVGRA